MTTRSIDDPDNVAGVAGATDSFEYVPETVAACVVVVDKYSDRMKQSKKEYMVVEVVIMVVVKVDDEILTKKISIFSKLKKIL